MKKENIKKAIKKFYEIRDIPYHISLSGEAKHCCEGKSKLLAECLMSLGYITFIRAGLFRWFDLKLPKSLNHIKHDDVCTHVFLEIENLEKESVFVDSTWNSGLKEAGFLISEWNGKSSTELAIPCFKIFSRMESKDHLDSFEYRDNKFYKAFNEYCDSFREKEKND